MSAYDPTSEPGLRSPVDFGPCGCPDPTCALKAVSERTRTGDSPRLLKLRERIREDAERRARFGILGRSL